MRLKATKDDMLSSILQPIVVEGRSMLRVHIVDIVE